MTNQIFLETRMFRLSDGEEIMILAFGIIKRSPLARTICDSGMGLNGRFLDLEGAISPKWCKIRPWLLLKTNRKPYERFLLVPRSTTLS